MKDVSMKQILSMVVATVLLAATVLCATSCDKANSGGDTATATTVSAETLPPTEIGEGAKAFSFEVTHLDGTTKSFTVKTDAKTVGEALVGVGLIAGDQGAYGLYVKTVDGELLDWDTHKKYWAFYINGEMAMTAVDKTDITAGAVYAFRAE